MARRLSWNGSTLRSGLWALLAAPLGCGLASGGDRRDSEDVLGGSCRDGACEPGAPVGGSGDAQQPGVPEDPFAPCGDGGVVWASLELRDQAGLDALAGCERVAGNLALSSFVGMDVTPLRSLRFVDGTVSVYGANAPGAGALAALSALEQAGNVVLQDLSVPNLAQLARLRRIVAATPEAAVGRSPAPDTRAAGGLMIARCSQLRRLSGLDSLEELSWLEASDNAALVSLDGMSRVSQLLRLHVRGSPLSNLEGVEALHVQDLSIFTSPLTDLSGLGDASSLVRLTLADNQRLTSLEGARLPARMQEVLLSNDDALGDLRGLEGLREVTRLSLGSAAERPALASLAGLDALQTVGSLELSGFPLLRNFVGLEALSRVDRLSVARSAGVSSLEGLSGLVQAGAIFIEGSLALSSVAGLDSPSVDVLTLSPLSATSLAGLERVTLTGTLQLQDAAQLRSLDGLPQLAASASLSLVVAPVLEDLAALVAVRSLRGLGLIVTSVPHLDALANLRQLSTLELGGNQRLTQIDGVSQVSGLTGLSVTGNPALRTLPTFANVRSEVCSGCALFGMTVAENAALETGPGLPGLEQADFVLVESNPRLSNLLGLAELRSVRSLTVRDNAALTEVSLSSLTQAGRVRIRENPVLDDTPLAPLRAIPDGSIKIASNQSGPAQLPVCPWIADGECDENLGDCAPGTDSPDCF